MKTERLLGLAQKWITVLYMLVRLFDAVLMLVGGANNYGLRRLPA
jgi:hypothetical protein